MNRIEESSIEEERLVPITIAIYFSKNKFKGDVSIYGTEVRKQIVVSGLIWGDVTLSTEKFGEKEYNKGRGSLAVFDAKVDKTRYPNSGELLRCLLEKFKDKKDLISQNGKLDTNLMVDYGEYEEKSCSKKRYDIQIRKSGNGYFFVSIKQFILMFIFFVHTKAIQNMYE